MTWCLKNFSILDINTIILHLCIPSKKEPSGNSKTFGPRKAPVREAVKKTIDHLLLKRLYRAFARESS